MLPYWCLLDILKFLNRSHIERIQVTNRMLNNIVNQNFASYPLRIMPDIVAHVQIENNELVKAFYPDNDTIFVIRVWLLDVFDAVTSIAQEFTVARERCRLRIVIDNICPINILDFHFYNVRTNEVLELKHISAEEANEFGVKKFKTAALLLERKALE
ncbi:hypothetical protein DdX_11960 [Ditylenchus destructor]|uniref:F-box domain-containing protein n=1 Tax=Ditylenchus destructor TaxID=166010 RepID=A0AAD4MZS7_9BILA|nr:hypothetical protein DdX_11960 [Ditylenchus destructor]